MSRWVPLAGQVAACTACMELSVARKHVVVGDYPPGARVLLVGEAPGAQEDATGRPFVGRAGQALDAALEVIGMPRPTVAVLNILKCRPPGNRRPLAFEMANCRGWLDRQIGLIDPAVIVGLGLTAVAGLWDGAATAKKSDFVLRSLRERPLTANGYRFLATYHPSGALRHGPNGAPMQALRDDLARARAIAADAT
ncbi:MAG TPA: uracil-DNA glycosylase [Frankiaceae bacterium]|nr:uracil-DNA glycosylase [Frankiaceae bacterium]